MEEPEFYCEACKIRHRAGQWYYREGRSEIYSFREWLCAGRYPDIPLSDRQLWRASTVD
jgi:hypothetical protein